MSLPQSNIDWTRYMEGLQGKANLDLNNTADKLADSFMSKLVPDYSAGINILGNATFTCPCNGILLLGAGIKGYAYYKSNLFSLGDYNATYVHWGGTSGIETSIFIVQKNEILTRVDYKSDSFTRAMFYPLKGAN